MIQHQTTAAPEAPLEAETTATYIIPPVPTFQTPWNDFYYNDWKYTAPMPTIAPTTNIRWEYHASPSVKLPIAPNKHLKLSGDFPISKKEWKLMMKQLKSMKDGLVRNDEQEQQAEKEGVENA